MKRSVLLFGLALLLIGGGPQADAAQSSADAPSETATSDAQETSAQEAPAPEDLPPSRAGDVQPAANYEAALSDILGQIVTDDGPVRYDLLKGPLQRSFAACSRP